MSAGSRRSMSGSSSSAPEQTRVRWRSSGNLAKVKKLPSKEAEEAVASRRGIWGPAPADDSLWDGEGRVFHEKELTEEELREKLRARDRAEKGFVLAKLFSRPNYKKRAEQILSGQGSYVDPYAQIFDLDAIDEDSEEDDEEGLDEEEFGEKDRKHPPPLDIKPQYSALKGKGPGKKKKKERGHLHEMRRKSLQPEEGAEMQMTVQKMRTRGFSAHRDSLFDFKKRQILREVTDRELMFGAVLGSVVLTILVAIVNFAMKRALGMHVSALDAVFVISVQMVSLAGVVMGLQFLPEQQREDLRNQISDLLAQTL